MEVNRISLYIKNILFNKMSKEILIFVFFLILSGIFWLILTLNETYEREIKVTMQIKGIPKNVVLTSDEVDTLRVMVRDKGWVLIRYLYEKERNINISFKNHDRGNGYGIASSSDVKRLVIQQMEMSTTVNSVKPDRIEFFYNNGERKRVPVRWAGRVIPEQLYFISHVQYWPDSVDIYSSKEKLDSINAIYTEPLNYVGFRDTLIVNCKASHPKDVKVVPEQVRVGFFTDVLTEESIDGIPIKAVNMPEGKVLRTFPPKVKVHFVTGVSQFHSLRPEDFTVIADYHEISQNPSDKCNIYLKVIPHGISRATLATKQVDYLIEEQE
ncbi:MAG: YbbR-like domain-containing protein [Prevotella sp.]|nr:YbbR-like domain-containing protein [Prevotella sp.]MBQ8152258.1 YbbR-like domain-containing protein [Prevotella sp.]MBQ8713635.1 YbbR-like domain-containing protein [Prevotella sp.]